MDVFFVDAMQDNKEEAEDLNADQLDRGLDVTGNKFKRKYRNDDYARFKKHIGSISSPTPDLKVTGKYHRAIKLQKKGLKFQMINTDSKYQELIGKYPNHLGLTVGSRKVLAEDLVPNMVFNMKKWLRSRI